MSGMCRACGKAPVQAGPYCPRCEDNLQHLGAMFHSHSGLDLCGCGDPDAARDLIVALLELAPFYEDEAWEKAAEMIGGAGAVQIVLSVLTSARLLEHGTSLSGSWITAKGRHYLALMREYDLDDTDDAGLPHHGEDCPVTCPHAIDG